ncbi:MAG: helix-turn-helix transcriptional regulator, partial [Senegalia sp. (in: firmicutes)]
KSVKNDLKIKKFILPTESRLIIEQIKNCPYNCYLKDMYLEAKVFELFSICLNNMMEQNIDKTIDSGLSKTEIESIYRAREILDSSMDTHITIRQISKLVYLNEYKLKTGFKEIFGKPLYAYKLDKRMELARELLTMGNTDINKIASMVGYASGDSFSKAFHKRYGVRPIEYL